MPLGLTIASRRCGRRCTGFDRATIWSSVAVGGSARSSVVRAIQGSLRATDAVYRLGGEEFLVILSVPTLDGLAAAGERLRTMVLDLAIEHLANVPHGVVSISIGGTMIEAADLADSDETWFARIDGALYRAKDGGRNRVELASRSDLALDEVRSA